MTAASQTLSGTHTLGRGRTSGSKRPRALSESDLTFHDGGARPPPRMRPDTAHRRAQSEPLPTHARHHRVRGVRGDAASDWEMRTASQGKSLLGPAFYQGVSANRPGPQAPEAHTTTTTTTRRRLGSPSGSKRSGRGTDPSRRRPRLSYSATRISPAFLDSASRSSAGSTFRRRCCHSSSGCSRNPATAKAPASLSRRGRSPRLSCPIIASVTTL